MKKLIYVAIFLQLSISSLLLADPSDPVYFADSNLQLAVEAELGITDPNQIDMLGLTYLSANSSGIFDLTGLEYATDVNELHLSNNLISDLSDISALTSLIYLYLNNNQIIDISAVENLVNLDTLFLSINDVNDLSPVSGLTGLTELYLGRNQIINISSLSGLSNLTVLDLTSDPNLTTSNQVVDISAVSNLTSLEKLYLTNNLIVDISPVSNLTSLLTLYLANNEIVDIPDMSNLTRLQHLRLTDNRIIDIFGLVGEELNDLESLKLAGNLLDKVSYCAYLEIIKNNNPSLTTIEVDDYPLDENGQPTACIDHDVCSDAIEITENNNIYTYSGTSDGATGIEVSNCGEGVDELWDYNDVWHSYTPVSNEAVDISLCGSSFDTTLAVYDSCGGTRLACNDQHYACGSESLVTMGLTAGVEYLIRVAGYNGDTGNYTLTITDAPVPPGNNTCQDAIEIVQYTPVTGSTITAYGPDITSCTLSDTRDVWYSFSPTVSARYLIDPNGSDYNATLSVFNGCEGEPNELVCNDLYCDYDYYGRCIDGYKSRIIVNMDVGETYYIRISGFAGKGGNYNVTVTLAADIYKDDDLDGLVDIFDLDRLLQEWMSIDDEGDFIYVISDADIAFAEGMDTDAGSGGDKFIDLRDFAVLCAQWDATP